MTSIHEHSAFHVRFTKGLELIEKYPEHVPVMFSCSKDDVQLDRDTIMCPRDMQISMLVMQFRKFLTEDRGTSGTMGFIFSIRYNDEIVVPRLSETMGELHDKYHSPDMWLVLKIEKEDIFG
jgi:hypothetical protein